MMIKIIFILTVVAVLYPHAKRGLEELVLDLLQIIADIYKGVRWLLR